MGLWKLKMVFTEGICLVRVLLIYHVLSREGQQRALLLLCVITLKMVPSNYCNTCTSACCEYLYAVNDYLL